MQVDTGIATEGSHVKAQIYKITIFNHMATKLISKGPMVANLVDPRTVAC
jgi:hypothetical protein